MVVVTTGGTVAGRCGVGSTTGSSSTAGASRTAVSATLLGGCAGAEAGGALTRGGAEALDVLERELVADECGVLRWIPPSCFLALCDAIAVIAASEGREVAWAECEADAEGVAPPPMIRVATSDGHAHVPLGLEVLRWCVMPRRPGEVVPPLRAWLHDRLASR